MSGLQERLDSVKEAQPQQAIGTLRDIALGSHSNDGDNVRVKETAVQQLADTYAKQKDAAALKQLLVELRPLFGVISKAKTAKLVRVIIEAIAKVPDSSQLQVRASSLRLSRHAPLSDGIQAEATQAAVINVPQQASGYVLHAAWSDPLRCFFLHAAYISQRPDTAQDLLCTFGPPARQHAAAIPTHHGLHCM